MTVKNSLKNGVFKCRGEYIQIVYYPLITYQTSACGLWKRFFYGGIFYEN